MGLIFDIILIAIIILNVIICYKKGLVKLAVGLIAVFVAIIASLIFYQPVSNMIIKNTEIDDKIKETIVKSFSAEESNGVDTKTDDGMMKYINKYVDDTVNKTRNEIVLEAADVITVKLINIIAILGIFILVRLVLLLLTFVADAITSLPILKQFNEAGGIIYGIIKSLLIIYVILAIMFVIICTTGNETLSTAISTSHITKIFYDNNILLKIIFK